MMCILLVHLIHVCQKYDVMRRFFATNQDLANGKVANCTGVWGYNSFPVNSMPGKLEIKDPSLKMMVSQANSVWDVFFRSVRKFGRNVFLVFCLVQLTASLFQTLLLNCCLI